MVQIERYREAINESCSEEEEEEESGSVAISTGSVIRHTANNMGTVARSERETGTVDVKHGIDTIKKEKDKYGNT